MESDPTLMCELLVGLGEVDVVGINDDGKGPLWVTVRSRSSRPVCQGCAGPVWSKGDRPVRLVDLPVFGRPVRLWWRKRRWMCPDRTCEGGSFVEQDPSVAPERGLLTSRAGRWATVQVGRLGRTVSEVAGELGCDWHTVYNEVIRWGEALLEADTGRYGSVEAVGVDETLFWREGRWRTKRWCTSVVDVKGRQLLDIVPGRTAKSAAGWFRAQPADWRAGIRWAVLDMSGSYQVAYDQILPHARQVAHPFHVVRLANQRLDEVRRRVQNETLGHRGRKGDPLYRIRRRITKHIYVVSEGLTPQLGVAIERLARDIQLNRPGSVTVPRVTAPGLPVTDGTGTAIEFEIDIEGVRWREQTKIQRLRAYQSGHCHRWIQRR